MQKRIVIRNGKKYVVNTPSYGDCGWEDGIGAGAPTGTLWMYDADAGGWFAITLTGTSASAMLHVDQNALTWASNDLGYNLLYDNSNGKVYQTYLSGSSGSVNIYLSQTPWPDQTDYKPYLWLLSTDNYFYAVYASGSAPVFFVDQNSRIKSDLPPSP